MNIAYDAPATYRKRPVVISAIRFHIEMHNQDEVAKFLINGGAEWEWSPGSNTFEVKTLEGRMRVNPGDWVIRGVQGEFYPCKDSIFQETYQDAF